MTQQNNPVYSTAEHPDLSFAKIPHEQGMSYEFDLRTEVSPLFEKFARKYHKAESLPPAPGYEAPKRGKIFDFFYNNSGHVFFNLVMKKDNQIIGQRQIGFSADKTPDPEKAAKIKIGVPGYVFDQEKSDPSYHFHKTYKLTREQFDNVVRFVEDSIKNPPTYHWPVAMNCARFAKKAAQAADIPNASLTSVFNLPITTQVYMGVSKVADKVEKAAKKIKKIFSSDHMAPVPEKKQDAAGRLTEKLLKRKQNER